MCCLYLEVRNRYSLFPYGAFNLTSKLENQTRTNKTVFIIKTITGPQGEKTIYLSLMSKGEIRKGYHQKVAFKHDDLEVEKE